MKYTHGVKKRLGRDVGLTGVLLILKFLCCLLPFSESSCILWVHVLSSYGVFEFSNAILLLQRWDEFLVLFLLIRWLFVFTRTQIYNLILIGKVLTLLGLLLLYSIFKRFRRPWRLAMRKLMLMAVAVMMLILGMLPLLAMFVLSW